MVIFSYFQRRNQLAERKQKLQDYIRLVVAMYINVVEEKKCMANANCESNSEDRLEYA